MQAMWWCGPQARSAFLCIKWCHLLTKRPIFSWARAEPALAKRVSWQGGGAKKTPIFAKLLHHRKLTVSGLGGVQIWNVRVNHLARL